MRRALGPFLCLLALAASADPRIRTVAYDPDTVYVIHGHVGYQIALEFEPGEAFVGLGAGDLEGLSFTAQNNHLFLKPKAQAVATNLTILTTRRLYHVDYTVSAHAPGASVGEVIYALRFQYPKAPEPVPPEALLATAFVSRPLNERYAYCGHPSLKPVAASDDGVHTRIRFGARAEFPAIFVRNDDGTESLLNFTIEGDDVIIHRIARQFIVRRGRLTGCLVNQAFSGGGQRLDNGTVSPDVVREPRLDSR